MFIKVFDVRNFFFFILRLRFMSLAALNLFYKMKFLNKYIKSNKNKFLYSCYFF